MASQHEYSVIGGINRARIGHIIGIIAALTSSAIVTAVLYVVDVARSWGLGAYVPQLILWPFTAFTLYGVLYLFFDRHFWKIPAVAGLFHVPDLSGDWMCEGQTINPDKTPGNRWAATVTILQSWDKIRVRLKTAQSGSNSISAALLYDEADGYRLMYSYRNDPNIGEVDLRPHLGHAEIVFNKDLRSGTGEYFNGHGRYTFGTMKFTKA